MTKFNADIKTIYIKGHAVGYIVGKRRDANDAEPRTLVVESHATADQSKRMKKSNKHTHFKLPEGLRLLFSARRRESLMQNAVGFYDNFSKGAIDFAGEDQVYGGGEEKVPVK
ncbi:hypothetical protein [Endozoicomonas ascidiicola]|uniref:hypothetical protein n=1 Tax=Endozoicomonas ascidiicola TaxID=1698521 RepID=UPI000834B3C6|nr:hypothetical protein [Endozoicomonas ascidiicola]